MREPAGLALGAWAADGLRAKPHPEPPGPDHEFHHRDVSAVIAPDLRWIRKRPPAWPLAAGLSMVRRSARTALDPLSAVFEQIGDPVESLSSRIENRAGPFAR